MMYLYLVAEGTATPNEQAAKIADWKESAAVLARSEGEALAIAEAYDGGIVQPDNVVYNGQTIAAIAAPSERD